MNIAEIEAKIRAEVAAASAEPGGWHLMSEVYYFKASDGTRCGCALAACVRGRVEELDRRAQIPDAAAEFLGISHDDAIKIVAGFDFPEEMTLADPFGQLGARLARELLPKKASVEDMEAQ